MTPPHLTVLTADYADEAVARRVERSLRPEIGAIDGERTTARLERDGATLRITVEADDLVALRAGCNTWLTLCSVAESAATEGEFPGAGTDTV